MRWQVVCADTGVVVTVGDDDSASAILALWDAADCLTCGPHTVRPHPDDVADTDRCPGNTSCGPGCNKPDGPCRAPSYTQRGGAA